MVVCFHYKVRLLNDKGTERRAALLEMRMDALQKDSDEFFTLCLQDTSDGLEQAVSLPPTHTSSPWILPSCWPPPRIHNLTPVLINVVILWASGYPFTGKTIARNGRCCQQRGG